MIRPTRAKMMPFLAELTELVSPPDVTNLSPFMISTMTAMTPTIIVSRLTIFLINPLTLVLAASVSQLAPAA